MEQERGTWPDLRYETWRETAATLQLWTQIVGKVLCSRSILFPSIALPALAGSGRTHSVE